MDLYLAMPGLTRLRDAAKLSHREEIDIRSHPHGIDILLLGEPARTVRPAAVKIGRAQDADEPSVMSQCPEAMFRVGFRRVDQANSLDQRQFAAGLGFNFHGIKAVENRVAVRKLLEPCAGDQVRKLLF